MSGVATFSVGGPHEEDHFGYAQTVRRPVRVTRQGPLIPWPYLLLCTATLAGLIVMVLCQRAQLIKYQYALVDVRQAKAHTLVERAELKLKIQRLSALERVDGLSRAHYGMVRPKQRLVLDLSQRGLAASDQVTRTEHP